MKSPATGTKRFFSRGRIISLVLLAGIIIGFIIALQNGYLSDFQKLFRSASSGSSGVVKVETETESLDASKPYGGVYVVGMNQEFVMEQINDESHTALNQRYRVNATRCHISRTLDFDLSILNMLPNDDQKSHMDNNNNFIDGYYYVTVELDVTCLNEEGWLKGFGPDYWIGTIDEKGNYKITQEPRGREYSKKTDSHLSLSLEPGESVHIKLYYIVEDANVGKQLCLNLFSKSTTLMKNYPYILLQETD